MGQGWQDWNNRTVRVHSQDAAYRPYPASEFYWTRRGLTEDEATDEQRATVFRDALLELFPCMPDDDVEMVLNRAIIMVSWTSYSVLP